MLYAQIRLRTRTTLVMYLDSQGTVTDISYVWLDNPDAQLYLADEIGERYAPALLLHLIRATYGRLSIQQMQMQEFRH